VVQHDAGFALRLDGKPVKTPAGKPLSAPTRPLAEGIAAEWRAQGETIAPETMPLTKTLNTVLDRVAAHRSAIIDELTKYAQSDLLCYRAADPDELVRRQSAAWDPWLAWAENRFGARLRVATGMTYVEQPADAVVRLREAISGHDDHRLAALHAATTITGSAVLGLAFVAGALSADDAFVAAHVDETFQEERWGRDAEAQDARERRLAALRAGERYLALLAKDQVST
jgi:chaperone required for assembly of F1-ATPase